MEILAQTDYQDVYRITSGVILVVNKFKPMQIEGVKYPRVFFTDKTNSRTYEKGCQDILKKLTKECKQEYGLNGVKWSVPVGTVIYNNVPVEVVSSDEWEYQIKTTGERFSGNSQEMVKLLEIILQIIKADET